MFNSSPPFMTSIRHDTKAWKAQVWISFAAAAGLCAVGLAWLPGTDLDRAFMVMGYAFCLSTVFALAKHVRDSLAEQGHTPLWGAVVWVGFALAMALTACLIMGRGRASSTTRLSISTTPSFRSAPAISCAWRSAGWPDPDPTHRSFSCITPIVPRPAGARR